MAYLKPQSPLQYKEGDYFYPLTTVDQVIMEDGSRLNANLEDVSSKLSMELLWENASPESEFATQEILLDLSKYEFIVAATTHGTYIIRMDTENNLFRMHTGSSGQRRLCWRKITVAADKILVHSGTYLDLNNISSNLTIYDSYFIPKEFYGIR